MPTYEFRCPDGHEFEKFYRSISGAESQAGCPVCGKPAERMMSAAGFAFKGSGFYLTDYGKNAHRGEAPPTAGAADKAEATSSSDSAASSSDAPKSDSTKGDAGTSAKADSAKGDSAKGGEPSKSGSESKKADAKEAAPKGESKPAHAAPKPSAGE